jgi:hypothetical protein
VLKANNIPMSQTPMNPDFTHQLKKEELNLLGFTFCFARDLTKVVFGIILAAVCFLDSKLVNS